MLLYLHFQTRKVKKICFVWAAAVLTGCSSTPRVTADVTEHKAHRQGECNGWRYDTNLQMPLWEHADTGRKKDC